MSTQLVSRASESIVFLPTTASTSSTKFFETDGASKMFFKDLRCGKNVFVNNLPTLVSTSRRFVRSSFRSAF